ncbi:MAG: DUF424 family protein [Candidatus Micrarchaeota archaeon]|nr:DUF424 family protein [Candidatus Micrarchaeota archaeon]
MYMKIHSDAHGVIVAACDKDLIGKKLEQGAVFLDLEKYKSFYVGELVDEKTLETLLKANKFNSANLVGKKVIAIAIKVGLLSKSDILTVNKIPYAQAYKL